jgi:hypothetical protein
MKSMIKPFVKFMTEYLAKSMGWRKHRSLRLSGAPKAAPLPSQTPAIAHYHDVGDSRDRWARSGGSEFTEELPAFLRRSE